MKRTGTAIGLSLVLAACSTSEPAVAPPCPTTVVVQDIADLTLFRPGEGRDLTDVIMESKIVGFDGFCETEFEKGTASEVVVEMRVLFSASRGPANTSRKGSFDYFVVIADRDENPVQKHVFDTEVEFPANRNRIGRYEELTLTIPLKAGENGGDYTILVGFQLSPEQVDYNRSLEVR